MASLTFLSLESFNIAIVCLENYLAKTLLVHHFRLLPPAASDGGHGPPKTGRQLRRARADQLDQGADGEHPQRPPRPSRRQHEGAGQQQRLAHQLGKSRQWWATGNSKSHLQDWSCHKRNTMDRQTRQQQQQQQCRQQQQVSDHSKRCTMRWMSTIQ